MDHGNLSNYLPTGSAIYESNIVRELRQLMLEVRPILQINQFHQNFKLGCIAVTAV